MRIEEDLKLDFKDVLIRPKRSTLSSRSQVNIKRTFTFKHSGKSYEGIPVIAANMDTVGTIEMANKFSEHQMSVALHKHYDEEVLLDYFNNIKNSSNAFYSMGITENDYNKFVNLQNKLDKKIEFVCVDVANGYQESFVNFIKKLRSEYPYLVIMAGNVVTSDMTEELILAGADIIKVGIGPGSVCTTRVKTGVGYPQLSAIIECADAANGLGGLICGDGGCTSSGDVAKAFAAGAHFVMIGGMFAGTDESSGDLIEKDNKKYKRFYGMSSAIAMEKHSGGVAKYRAAEGKEVLIEYRGSVENIIQDILGGVRSTCTYVGAKNLKELTKRTTFIKVNNQYNDVFGKSV